MRIADLIIAKRDGNAHSQSDINNIVKGVMDESIKDYQLSAWLMAVCCRGMTLNETAYLTEAMAKSGQVLDLSSIGPIVGDKHSTGGVGDKATLVFVPLMAAAGVPMAKLSGRALGHTGGTIDKLEAIPGFNTALSSRQFIDQVKNISAAIGGQTSELAPADGKIYALRDVTGTVESIPLIAASVMSKKIAAGANLIVLDVKCGKGAFMSTQEHAHELAKSMAYVGKFLNKPVIAAVTDMEQPLGCTVGNALEVEEAIETLRGNGPNDLIELCLELGALALVRCGKYNNNSEAKEFLHALLKNGQALEKFRQIISAQGGDPNVIENPKLMPQAKLKRDLLVSGNKKKWIATLDGRLVAEACKLMGAGRNKKGDSINLAVGIKLHAKVGSEISPGQSVATIYADSEEDFQNAVHKLESAIVYSDSPVAVPPVILALVD